MQEACGLGLDKMIKNSLILRKDIYLISQINLRIKKLKKAIKIQKSKKILKLHPLFNQNRTVIYIMIQ